MTAGIIRKNSADDKPMPGLTKADKAYRDAMESANREFVARLQWAMAA